MADLRAAIFCLSRYGSWVNRYFYGINPFLLKFVNMPLFEYQLEFLSLIGIRNVTVFVDDEFREIEYFAERGDRWGFEISYRTVPGESTVEDMTLLADPGEGAALLVISGLIFIHYSTKRCEYSLFKSEEPFKIGKIPDGIQYYPPGSLSHGIPKTETIYDSEFKISAVRDVSDYYELSMEILNKGAQHFVLPGYNNDESIHIGMDVEIGKNIRFNKPVMIGDDTTFKPLSSIGPSAIIGNNVIIDRSTIVRYSIVYDDTYVGADLEISDKILYRDRVISPYTGDTIDIRDDFIVSPTAGTGIKSRFKKISAATGGFLLFSIPVVIVVLLIFLLIIQG